MNLLFVGSGNAGSWVMRGEQLARAMGARATTSPTDRDFLWADVVVLVKRAGRHWAKTVHAYGRKIVWDALDCWVQPTQNRMGERDAITWLQELEDDINPMLSIGATEAMAKALNKGVFLSHHCRMGLRPTPARETVSVVGYDGNPAYLGLWAPAFQAACEKRGWRFEVNPPDLSQVDILVSFRDGIWDGWMCREWKSGVKVVNAICAGRPIIMQKSAAWRELDPYGCSIGSPTQIDDALDRWTDYSARQSVVASCQVLAGSYTAESLGTWYRRLIAERARSVAA